MAYRKNKTLYPSKEYYEATLKIKAAGLTQTTENIKKAMAGQLGIPVEAKIPPTTALEGIEKELITAKTGTTDIQAGITKFAEEKISPTTPTLGAEVKEETPQDYSAIWTTEYGKSGLEDTKINIAGIDDDIVARKAARDKALLDEKGKPIPQWMITGRKALEIEAATGDLNRLIDQRNAMAEQFNTGIAEVERQVGYAIDYQEEQRRQLEATRAYEIEERMMKLREEEAAKPTGYAPPTSYKEWELAGKPGSFEDWLARTEDKPGKSPEDIESYAWAVLNGEKTLTSVPDDIEPDVRARVEELKKTERIYNDEEIKAQIGKWITKAKSDFEDATDEEIKEGIKNAITLSELTDPDRKQFNKILDEIVKEAGAKDEKGGGGLWDWLKKGSTALYELFKGGTQTP